MPESEININGFLYQFKFFATSTGFRFLERDKNMETLSSLGITEQQALEEIICQLTPTDYSSGPSQDQNFPKHNVWIFGYKYEDIELYIKLSDNFSFGLAKCVSLHKCEREITYPLKK